MLTVLPPALTDLEFNPEVNAGRDGDAMVDALLADVAAGLQQRFDLTLEDADVLELDSSTPQKFSRSTAHEAAMSRMCDYRVQLAQEQQNVDIASKVLHAGIECPKELVCTVLRHLVVAAPGAAFASNRDVAAFVAQLLGDDPLAGPYTVAKVRDLILCSHADQCVLQKRKQLGCRWCVQ